MYSFQKLFSFGYEAFCFSQFSCEKQLCFVPIRTNSDGTTTLHLTFVFFISIFFIKSKLCYDTILYINAQLRYGTFLPENMATMASRYYARSSSAAEGAAQVLTPTNCGESLSESLSAARPVCCHSAGY